MSKAETRVSTAHMPIPLAEKLINWSTAWNDGAAGS